jgi:hypothetical protein
LLLFVRWLSLPLLPFLSSAGVYHWPADLLPLLLWLAAVGIAGAFMYGGLAAAFGSSEARDVLSRLRGRIARS